MSTVGIFSSENDIYIYIQGHQLSTYSTIVKNELVHIYTCIYIYIYIYIIRLPFDRSKISASEQIVSKYIFNARPWPWREGEHPKVADEI
jgi:hypothetical protein